MGLFGNTLLLSYFLEREEGSAATVQVVGIASNIVMLLQVCNMRAIDISNLWSIPQVIVWKWVEMFG